MRERLGSAWDCCRCTPSRQPLQTTSAQAVWMLCEHGLHRQVAVQILLTRMRGIGRTTAFGHNADAPVECRIFGYALDDRMIAITALRSAAVRQPTAGAVVVDKAPSLP